jgi:hypothetical protein
MIKQNPNPSPIEKMWFGLSCFGGDKRDRTAEFLNPIYAHNENSGDQLASAALLISVCVA